MTFKIVQGDDKTFTINAKNGDGSVLDITGASFSVKVARSRSDETALITYTENDQVSIVDGPNGVLEIDFQSSDTEPLTRGTYLMQIKVVLTGGSYHLLGENNSPDHVLEIQDSIHFSD